MEHWTEYTRFFVALFVILDPFAAVPIFLALTKTYTAGERSRIANTASLTVLVVLVAAALMGETLLHSMGTSLASFRVGGGIVLLMMALAMLRAQTDMVGTSPAEMSGISCLIQPEGNRMRRFVVYTRIELPMNGPRIRAGRSLIYPGRDTQPAAQTAISGLPLLSLSRSAADY